MEEKKKSKFKWRRMAKLIMGLVIVLVIIAVAIFIEDKFMKKSEPEIITESSLQKILNVSDLSTFEAVYNGVSKVNNEKKPEKIDYYVSYDAKVKAGFDFEKMEILVDNDSRVITVNIPEIEITDVTVDIASLDYIFINDKANTSTVSEEAYKKCIEDVETESGSESEIFELAAQNAKNVVKALVEPFIAQMDTEYELVINVKGEDENEEITSEEAD